LPIYAIVDSLAPVFLVIALGWMLKHAGFLTVQSLHDINRLIYWVGIPCFLFYKIAGASPVAAQIADLFLVMLAATGSGIVLGYGLARCLAVPRVARGTFVQAVFRGNLAFVGLPLIYYAFADVGEGSSKAEAAVLLLIGPMVVFYNLAAVIALLASRHGVSAGAIPRLLKELMTNPLLIACGFGLLYSLLGWSLPVLAQRTFAAVGQMALPLALICIGGALATVRIRGGLVWSGTAAAAKVIMMPMLGYGFGSWVGLSPEGMRIVLILLACPTASVSYVLVRQLGGDEALASSAILMSVILAMGSLAVILALG
jgi:hypothetical protein